MQKSMYTVASIQHHRSTHAVLHIHDSEGFSYSQSQIVLNCSYYSFIHSVEKSEGFHTPSENLQGVNWQPLVYYYCQPQ